MTTMCTYPLLQALHFLEPAPNFLGLEYQMLSWPILESTDHSLQQKYIISCHEQTIIISHTHRGAKISCCISCQGRGLQSSGRRHTTWLHLHGLLQCWCCETPATDWLKDFKIEAWYLLSLLCAFPQLFNNRVLLLLLLGQLAKERVWVEVPFNITI